MSVRRRARSPMLTCQEIEPLLTAHVDGEATAEAAARVEAHLAWCASCRHRLAAERACRELLRAEAGRLRPHAPETLRARCAQGAAAARAARAGTWRHRWVPLSAAAALLLAIAGVLVVGTARPVSALAARLAFDHVICFSRESTQSSTPDAAQLEAVWADRHGWPIVVPADSASLDLKLIELRRCQPEGEIAHLMYRREGRPVSLYILRESSPGGGSLEITGHQVLIWSSGGRTYAVIGQSARDTNETAAYVSTIVG
jgi:anti-sigma factor RsiW